MSSNSTTTTASSTATDQSSSDKGQHSAMRKLRGVPGTTRFCVKRDGSCAFVFDYANDAFVLIDLQSGAHTLIETERPELDGAQLWSDIHLISRYADIYPFYTP
uniref:Uncharacterized protein n=1 Tax=Plectus sambesii TaxID=2011161 RepID=A0A914WXR2_9BILA